MRPHPQYPLSVRVSADGSTFAAWEPGLSPSGIRLLILDGQQARESYEHTSAGVLQPSFDGTLLFTGAGLYTADLKHVSPEQFRGMVCFPSYHPAYFLGYAQGNGIDASSSRSGAKLSLFTTGDKRLLVSLSDLDELNESGDPSTRAMRGTSGALPIDKRVHFFPSASLLVTVADTSDRLVLRRLDVTESLEKAGIDYLFVASIPPAAAVRGSALDYAISVKSKNGKVGYTLDSGPPGMAVALDGRLQWKVPEDQPAGPVGVVVTIRDASGQEIFHAFTVRVH